MQVVYLSRWSEKGMRDLLRREVDRVLGSHLPDTSYLMVEQVLLLQPGLHLQRSAIPVNLSVQTGGGAWTNVWALVSSAAKQVRWICLVARSVVRCLRQMLDSRTTFL